MFQVNLISSVVSTFWRRNNQIEKLPFGSLFCVQNDLSFSRSVKTIDGSPYCSHQATTVQHFCESLPPFFFSTTARAVKRDRFIITGKLVLYFKSIPVNPRSTKIWRRLEICSICSAVPCALPGRPGDLI